MKLSLLFAFWFVTITKCSFFFCGDGYYNAGQESCQKCHTLCLTCYGPSADECLSCAIAE